MTVSKLNIRYTYLQLLYIICLGYGILFCTYMLCLYWQLHSSVIDIGSFNQILWMASKGINPTTSLNNPLNLDQYWLGFHFTPLVFLLTPLYWIAPYPEWLFLIHATCISATAIIIYFTSLRLVTNEKIAFLWAMVYLTYGNIIASINWEFHEQSLAVPIVALSMWAIISRKLNILIACLICLILTKEHYGLTAAFMGISYGLYNKDYKTGLYIFCAGLIAFVSIMFIIMPYFNHGTNHMMMSDTHIPLLHLRRYNWLHWEWKEVLGHALILLTSKLNIYFYLFLLAPLLFLPFFSLSLLIPIVPEFFINALSDYDLTKTPISYHSSSISPILIIAACSGSIILANKIKQITKKEIPIACILINLFTLPWILLFFPLPHIESFSKASFFYPESLHKIEAMLPADAKIMAPSDIGTYFSQRKYIFPLQHMAFDHNNADAVVIHIKPGHKLGIDLLSGLEKSSQSLVDNIEGHWPLWLRHTEQILHDKNWGVTLFDQKWLVIEKNKPSIINQKEIAELLNYLHTTMQ